MHWILFQVISDLKLSPRSILNNIIPLPFWHPSIQKTFNQLKCLAMLLLQRGCHSDTIAQNWATKNL